jgi:hypothetical protein
LEEEDQKTLRITENQFGLLPEGSPPPYEDYPEEKTPQQLTDSCPTEIPQMLQFGHDEGYSHDDYLNSGMHVPMEQASTLEVMVMPWATLKTPNGLPVPMDLPTYPMAFGSSHGDSTEFTLNTNVSPSLNQAENFAQKFAQPDEKFSLCPTKSDKRSHSSPNEPLSVRKTLKKSKVDIPYVDEDFPMLDATLEESFSAVGYPDSFGFGAQDSCPEASGLFECNLPVQPFIDPSMQALGNQKVDSGPNLPKSEE